MAESILDYLGTDFGNPLDGYPVKAKAKALRKKAVPEEGQDGPWHDLSTGSGLDPAVQQPSLAPGVQSKPEAPSASDSKWTNLDPEFIAAQLGMTGMDAENANIEDQMAIVASLRGRKHNTGIGGALGAAGDILNSVNLKKMSDQRAALAEKGMDEWRKYAFRNSANPDGRDYGSGI